MIENNSIKRQPLSRDKRKAIAMDRIFIVAMLILPLTTFICSWVFVNFNSVLMAFQLPTGEWSLDTFALVFRNLRGEINDPDFALTLAFKNAMIWFFINVMKLPFHLLIAYFFYKRIAGYKAFQIIFYLPTIISDVVTASLYSELLAPTGPIGLILGAFGVEKIPAFLADSRYTMSALVIYSLWLGWGGNMLLFSGALARIPTEMLESARLDGVGPFREFVNFIIPMVWSTLSTLLILNMTSIFGMTGPVMLFTQGNWGTMTLGYWIYHKVLYGGPADYNEVAATGLLFTLITVPVIMFFRWLIERVPIVEY